jgi:hypothetical protein
METQSLPVEIDETVVGKTADLTATILKSSKIL